MALQDKYDERFEKLWRPYPKWPAGRSKKIEAYRAFVRADKVLKFTESDLEHIEDKIHARLRDCETWQTGNQYGPVAMAVFFNQRLWNEDYPKVGPKKTQFDKRYYDVEEPVVERYTADPEVARAALQKARGELH